MAKLPVCGDCGHRFDPADRRAFLPPTGSDLTPSCPACCQMERGATAWAIWNSCQGIFADRVFGRRYEADKVLAEETAEVGDFGGTVVPVRVLLEPEERHAFRHYDEAEWDRANIEAEKRRDAALSELAAIDADAITISGPAW